MTSQAAKPLLATAIAVASAALAISGSAVSLGGISVAGLFGWSAPVTIPVPTVVAYDDFACAGSLDGRVDDTGNTWADHGGDWQCLGSGEVGAGQQVALGHATVDAGVSDDLRLVAQLSAISAEADRSGGGVSFLSDGISHIYLIYERDEGRITLGKSELLVATTLATVAVTDRATARIAVEIDQPTVRVLVDGTAVITYTMSSLETTLFGANTRFGLSADHDNGTSFDWFLVDLP